MQAGQVVETSSGWLLEVTDIKWWSEDDGAVYGRAFSPARGGSWSPEKYIGTVRGLTEMAVSRMRVV